MKEGKYDTSAPSADASAHAKIAARAYELWEQYGRPNGCDVAIWLEAERELAVQAAEPQLAPAAPPPVGRNDPNRAFNRSPNRPPAFRAN